MNKDNEIYQKIYIFRPLNSSETFSKYLKVVQAWRSEVCTALHRFFLWLSSSNVFSSDKSRNFNQKNAVQLQSSMKKVADRTFLKYAWDGNFYL